MRIRLPWMSRVDRRRWQSATTLADLGHLTAAWLEGDIKSQPAYQAGFGADDETTPLIPTLARLNRLGFVTNQSQPGFEGLGYDGRLWRQRAAVSGWVADPDMVRQLTTLDGLIALSGPGGRQVTVTTVDGQPYTWFGMPLPEPETRLFYDVLNDTALAALLGATQITLIDLEYGPSSRLWDALNNLTSVSAS